MFKNKINSLYKTITLTPYGTELLTPGANLWIVSCGLLILVMASLEAVTWALVSSFIVPESFKVYTWSICSTIGLLIFCVIWIVDASFVTLDLHDSRGPAGEPRKQNMLIRWIIGLFGNKTFWGIGLRLGIIVGSVFVTAPLLVQLLLAGNIDAQITLKKSQLIENKRVQILKNIDPSILSAESELLTLEEKHTAEIAGKGRSGAFGNGPVAKSLKDRIKRQEDKLKILNDEKANTLKIFDHASEELLRGKYGIEIPGTDWTTRYNLQKSLVKEHPNKYVVVERLAQFLLALVFIALLALKAFQPRSVSIYLNDFLQGKWGRYKTGTYNAILNDEDRWCSDVEHGMDPYDFYTWVFAIYGPDTQKRKDELDRLEKNRIENEINRRNVELNKRQAEQQREAETKEREDNNRIEQEKKERYKNIIDELTQFCSQEHNLINERIEQKKDTLQRLLKSKSEYSNTELSYNHYKDDLEELETTIETLTKITINETTGDALSIQIQKKLNDKNAIQDKVRLLEKELLNLSGLIEGFEKIIISFDDDIHDAKNKVNGYEEKRKSIIDQMLNDSHFKV